MVFAFAVGFIVGILTLPTIFVLVVCIDWARADREFQRNDDNHKGPLS